WYHERLLTAPDARPARDYLRSRGYDGEVARAYKLGWAPDDWDQLARALKLPDDVLQDTGLGRLNRRNRQQDAFRARVLFPIFDVRGDPVAFGGRALPGGPRPSASTTGRSATRSTSRWPRCHRAATRPTWPAPIPRRSPRRWRRRGRSSSSASSGRWPRPTCDRPRAGRARPKPRWPR